MDNTGVENMNILYFVDEFPPFFRGGLGTYAMEMSKQFIKFGHNLTIFSRNTGDDPTVYRSQGLEVHRPLLVDATDILPLMISEDVKKWSEPAKELFCETMLYNFLSSTKLLNDLVKKEKRSFDIIVANDWLSAIGALIVRKTLKLPFVFHLHSTEQGRAWNGSPTIKEIERLAANEADLIITVSYAMRDELMKLGYNEKKIRVIYNGVDPEKYNPARYGEEEISRFKEAIGIKRGELLILFVGRLTWVKGADSLVQAMPLILKEVPNVKLVILGRGDQEDMIKHMVASLGIQNQVVLEFKYVSEEERILHYAASDVVVLPSKYEPFGIVCTEAMSMGKPVVVGATGTSGLREQVIPSGTNRCGAHINPYDPSDIARFTIELLKIDVTRKILGENARARVLDNFTWEKTAKETIKVYQEVIKGHSSG